MAGLGGLRNLLVHLYTRIDPNQIGEHASRAPSIFDQFGAEIGRWLSAVDEK